ncbi:MULTISPECIES: GNAT family N-acetyltransferase [Micromonospora]|uniref:Protein N-acetyltransferase, RimJ/RimL family n=1 Tax=Micromonospora yangpuensis TaxID=683228 RepID=A0A1C6UGJ7_9ACTN|nr:GNAT family N-acetyltransferase [Micromonospora yangpuensis]GGM05179.1 UDP-4-amino-4,6-dideoxy-N-acetyl-beta-L-altrosamine N-acetyltransferase [Micromonospora yangpuensis]SCL53009.1 Protein N-acetyltransferase, RimJ/RimL family [Micromonospora yangpuensis]
MTGSLRPATDDDLARILRWRNHPQVRAVSLTRHEITPAEHAAWWARTRTDPDRRVLVHRHREADSAVVTFSGLTSAHRALVWGFYLDIDGLDARRELLRAWMSMQEAAIAYAFGELGARSLGGETLADNKPVLALHRRFGFHSVRRYQRDVDGVPHQVVWTELSREP